MEESFAAQQTQKQRQLALMSEEARLREIDRQDAAERAKRRQEYKRLNVLSSVTNKIDRVRQLHEAKSNMVTEALKNRADLEMQRIKEKFIPKSAGPGEHIGQKFVTACAPDAPSWSFGISRDMDNSFACVFAFSKRISPLILRI